MTHFKSLGLINSASATSGKMDPVRFDISVHNEQLPAFKQGARLVFTGDSITDINRWRNESDRNHYLGHSFVFLLAGRLGLEIPEAQLDFYNRGISGNTVADLKARSQRDAIEMRPDVLTILVGTNDAAAEAVAPEHWLWDGVHPLPQGHELIARHWLKSVSARWPKDSLNP